MLTQGRSPFSPLALPYLGNALVGSLNIIYLENCLKTFSKLYLYYSASYCPSIRSEEKNKSPYSRTDFFKKNVLQAASSGKAQTSTLFLSFLRSMHLSIANLQGILSHFSKAGASWGEGERLQST